jgi:hypothetical protein
MFHPTFIIRISCSATFLPAIGKISLTKFVTQFSFPQNCGKDFPYKKKSPQNSFPHFCGNDFSHPKKAPKIPSRKIPGRISHPKNAPQNSFPHITPPKLLPAILREGFLLPNNPPQNSFP